MIYPNLVAENRYYWCNEAMARGADVTPELMKAVLKGEECLTTAEALNLSRYMFCKPGYLFSPVLSVMDRASNRHRRWMAELNQGLYEIWDAGKEGDSLALDYMNTDKRTRYVNMVLQFRNGGQVIYAEYRAAKSEMNYVLGRIREKKRKPRGLPELKSVQIIPTPEKRGCNNGIDRITRPHY